MSEQSDVDDVVKALYADWLTKHPSLQWIVDVDTTLGSALEQCFRDAYAKGIRYPFEQFKVCPLCKRRWEPQK
jgi:hypothetical protein